MVTHQLQVKRRTGKVRRPETDVLPLCHATNRYWPCSADISTTILVGYVNAMHRRKAVGSGGLQVQFNDEIEIRVYENSQSDQNTGSARKHRAALCLQRDRPSVRRKDGRETAPECFAVALIGN